MDEDNRIVIDPSGDITLVCGRQLDRGDFIKIQVSSALPTYSSPVFRAMLDGRFKEGRTLLTAAAVEIELPEDNAAIMAALCCCLHLQYGTGRGLHSSQIYELALLADKYDCVEVVKAYVELGVVYNVGTADHHGRTSMFNAAALLKHKSLQSMVAKEMVMKSKPDDEVPDAVLIAIANAKIKIASLLKHNSTDYSNTPNTTAECAKSRVRCATSLYRG